MNSKKKKPEDIENILLLFSHFKKMSSIAVAEEGELTALSNKLLKVFLQKIFLF